MKKILGLDLGTNSIGWAVVNEAECDDEKSSIVKLGVRAIKFDTFVSSDTKGTVKGDPADFFNAGKGVSPNAGRTLMRSMRRNLQRYKLRRTELVNILRDSGFISDDSLLSENGNNTTFETYRLRAKAVTGEISLQQLARVLLMINKKRGYKSSRKAKGGEDGALINGMDVAKRLYDDGLTPGELSLELLCKGKKYLPDFYSSDLQLEFDRIWNNQKKFYPEILTDAVKVEVNGKNASQTWAILAKYFNWSEVSETWNPLSATREKQIVERKLQGLKRTLKGDALKKENYEWRVKALSEKMNPEELAIVFQEINKQINSTSGYLGKISDRSKVLYFGKMTVGQYQMSLLEDNPNTSLKNMVFYRQDYLDEFNAIWEKQKEFHPELTDSLKHEIRDVVIFYQRKLKSQKGLIAFCELESEEKEVVMPDGKIRKITVGSKVIPRSSPIFQEFKIWQILNNVEVSVKGTKRKSAKLKNAVPKLFEGEESVDALEINGKRALLQEEKELLALELSVKEKLHKAEILSLLFETSERYDLNFKTIDGNRTGFALYSAYSTILEASGHSPINFKDSAKDIIEQVTSVFKTLGWKTDFLQYDSSAYCMCEKDSKKRNELILQPYYKLWHLLYSFEGDNSTVGNEKLIAKLQQLTGMDKEYAAILANVSFLEDYGSLSAKAISKILPYMKEGNMYDVACSYAGYRHSKESLTKEELEVKELKDRLEILPKNKLRNPVVEKILNQMVNVVNALIVEYGAFDEIRVELARELKKSAKEREDLAKSIADTTKLHEEYRKILQQEPFNLTHVTRNDIIRYKLYEELKDNGYKTLYSQTYIPQEKLFTGEFDIEHIIPQARLFDDSLSNKTLELRSVNIEKGKTTAYDYVLEKYGEEYAKEYENRCEKLFSNKRTKLKKLLTKEPEIEDGFIERDLHNTQYISRVALRMLKSVCKKVVATTGSITDKLRKDWQLVDVMKELNWNKYKAIGKVEYHENVDGRKIGRIIDWTKRNDHRHHAMDALTVSFTKDVFIQYFNNVNASQTPNSNEYAIKSKYFCNGKALPPIPLKEFRAEAMRHMEEILISIKARNKVVTNNVNKSSKKCGINKVIQQTPRGQLHQETIYGTRKEYVTYEEKIGSSFNEAKVMLVAKKQYRDALMTRLQAFGGDPKKAFTGKNALDKSPVWINDMHTESVPEKVKLVELKEVYTVRKQLDSSINEDKIVDPKIKRIVKERLAKDKDALKNLDENPIYLNEEKGIKVKRVKICGITNGVAIHAKRDKNGKLMYDSTGKTIPTDIVATGSNHHVAIYQRPVLDKKSGLPKLDEHGEPMYELEENVVTFLDAVVRANIGLPTVDKEYKRGEGWKFLFSMKQNEYFVFPNAETGFNPKEIDLLNPENYALISPNLFRAQRFSSKDYWFRHHLETTVVSEKNTQDILWKRVRVLSGLAGIVKVRVNHIGKIVAVGEY